MSLFPDTDTALAWLRRDRLNAAVLDGQTFDDDYLTQLLSAAQADAERALRVYLEPVQVLPEDATQAEKDALDEAGTRWVEEPGYDMEPDFFTGERWGYLLVRHKPIIAVQSMRFVYPNPMTGVFTVPPEWIRLDKKYGHIRLVPGAQAFAPPLAVWSMQIMGGGRTIPQMIQLRYTSGLTDAAAQWPDLQDLVLRMAAMRAMQGIFPSSSQSISADGLSQSDGIDLSGFQADIDARMERLREAMVGPKLMVV